MSRQQWYFERIHEVAGADASMVKYRLINRYSGLALSFTGDSLNPKKLRYVVTAPIRDWDAPAGNSRVWKAADQECIIAGP